MLRTGGPNTYVKIADSGNKREHAFCGNCGTPIYSAAIGERRTYGLRVGTLAERAHLPPVRRIWCRSALPWSANLEGLPHHATQ